MSKSKHSEAQIIAALKQVEAGRPTEDVARECGVSKHTMYAWKSKYGGLDRRHTGVYEIGINNMDRTATGIHCSCSNLLQKNPPCSIR